MSLLVAVQETPTSIIGFNAAETANIIVALRRAGIRCREGGNSLGLEGGADLVIDIRSHHPIMGGSTGWQVVRHLVHSGHRVIAVIDSPAIAPTDLPSGFVAVLRDCVPAKIANALQQDHRAETARIEQDSKGDHCVSN